ADVWTAPLIINKATGVKFGKSEDGAIWLNQNKTSAYKFYQFWLNCDDQAVAEYLKVFTLLKPDEIDNILNQFEMDRSSRIAQKALAYEVTKLIHGQDRAESVKRISQVLFSGADYSSLTSEDFSQLKLELPVAEAVI